MLVCRKSMMIAVQRISSVGILSLVLTSFLYWHSSFACERILVGPYLQTVTPTSIWVMWETDRDGESRVEFGSSSYDLSRASVGISEGMAEVAPSPPLRSRKTSYRETGKILSYIHKAQLADLSPDTLYYYRVRTGKAASPVYYFRTAPDPNSKKSFRFAIYGDNQQGANVHRSIVERGIATFFSQVEPLRGTGGLAFILNAGDTIWDGSLYRKFKEQFFEPLRTLSPFLPYYVAIGNHERNSPYYFNYFRFPQNGTAEFDQHWYSFRYSNARFIALDTNVAYRIPAQLDWLSGQLKEACDDRSVDFIFTFFHHPSFTELWTPGLSEADGATSGEREFSAQITLAIERGLDGCHKAGAQFFGHVHGYSRGQSRDAPLYWVGVGGGGGTLDEWGQWVQKDYPEYQKSFAEYGFAVVEVTGGRDPAFQVKWFTQGNDRVFKDNTLEDLFELHLNGRLPDPPRIESVERRSGAVVLRASPFSDPDEGEYHLESHWQCISEKGDYTLPLVNQWLRRENWFKNVDTNKGIDLTVLKIGEAEFGPASLCRVRYRDSNLVWSPWSSSSAIQRVRIASRLSK